MMINKTSHKKNTFFSLIAILTSWFAFILDSSLCYARTTSEREVPWSHVPILTLSGGLATATIGRSQTLIVNDDYTIYQYTAQHVPAKAFIAGIYTGSEIALNAKYLLQVGFGLYAPTAFTSKHNPLNQGVDPQSADQFSWYYKVNNQSFLVESKLLGLLRSQIHPYLLIGLGTAINKAYHYRVIAPPFLTFTPKFSNHEEVSLTYALGIGIDADLSQNVRFGLGYRFANLGQANLGTGVLNQNLFPKTLRQSDLYMHSLLAQLTWRFEK